MSSLVSQRTHAESDPAPAQYRVVSGDGFSEESPLQRGQGLPLVGWVFLGLIEDYRQGLVPPIVPLTLLKNRLSRYPVPEPVHQQDCLPEPREDERACSEDGAC